MAEINQEQAVVAGRSGRFRAISGSQQVVRAVLNWKAALMIVGSVIIFLVALQFIRGGASSPDSIFKSLLIEKNPIHTLGLGWMASYLVLSGSPIAAAALALLDSGVLNELQAFTMVVGTRFGAIFVTVFFGLIYYWEGTHSKRSLAVGVLAYLTTFWVALGALIIGLPLLRFFRFEFSLPLGMTDGLDDLLRPLVKAAMQVMPSWAVFGLGLALLMLSFKIVDKVLPDLRKHDIEHEKFMQMLGSPYAMFALGMLITLISPSVSVSCGILVPLYAKGYIRASRLVPYVMGANIATFSDTFLTALVLKNPLPAVHVVVTVVISIAVVSLGILIFGFSKYEMMIERWTDYFTENTARLALFLVIIFFVPLALLLL